MFLFALHNILDALVTGKCFIASKSSNNVLNSPIQEPLHCWKSIHSNFTANKIFTMGLCLSYLEEVRKL